MANQRGINPVTAGVVGAAVGVAVGVAAAELTDKKNRKAVGKKFGEFKEKGEKVFTGFKKTATEVKGKLEEFSSQAGDKVEEAKADLEKKDS